jgi:hypothetical protein
MYMVHALILADKKTTHLLDYCVSIFIMHIPTSDKHPMSWIVEIILYICPMCSFNKNLSCEVLYPRYQFVQSGIRQEDREFYCCHI